MNPAPANPTETIGRLDEVINHQLALATRGDYDAIAPLMAESEDLLKRLTAGDGLVGPEHSGLLADIIRRHGRIGLLLAAHRQELTGKLAQQGQSRKILRAYGSS